MLHSFLLNMTKKTVYSNLLSLWLIFMARFLDWQIQGKNLAKIKGNVQIRTVGAYQLKYIQLIFIKCFQYDDIRIMKKNKTL